MSDTSPDVPSHSCVLPSGAAMPLLGFGTWELKGSSARESTLRALEVGYRHLDTATVYGNEAEVGAALAASGVPRSEVFVTTKLPGSRPDEAVDLLAQSLAALGVDQLDLWLVHWPPDSGDVVGPFRRLLQAQADGLVRDVGVSNFDLDQLDEVHRATGVMPAVNQIRWSPLEFDRAVLDGHRDRGVLLEGYSTLKGGTLTDPTVVEVAGRLGVTAAQVLIRWHLEHGIVVIPRSSDAGRIAENADVAGFTLSPDDVAALDGLGG